jgi:hypothetical protein
MRPLVKPLVAVVAIALATSASAAMSPKDKGTAPMGSSCGPVVDTKMGRVMNVNSPTREVGSCWQERFAFGGDATFAFQRADGMATSDSTDSFFNVRAVNLYTDIMLNKQMAFHIMLADTASLTNNMPVSDTELDGTFFINEAYLTVSDFMKSPMYIKAGRSFTPFGNYSDPYPTVYSLNQGFVESYNTNLTLGFASNAGYEVSAFVFENETSNDWDEFGFRVGYQGDLMGAMKGMNFKINASYVDNYSALTGESSESATVTAGEADTNADLDESAYDVQAGISVRNFNLGLEYFKTSGKVLNAGTTATAEPKVVSASLSYDFLAGDKKADAHFMYEKASDASAMSSIAFSAANQAEKHYNLGVNLDVAKNAALSLDFHKFEPFSTSLNDQKQVVAAMKVAF